MKRALLVAALGAAVAAALVFDLHPRALEPAEIRDFILSFGLAAPIAYAALYAVLVFIPYGTTAMTVAAGLAFGTAAGAGLTYVVTLVASLMPMTLARRIGRDWFETKIGGTRAQRLADLINRNAFWVFFYLRLLPTIPYEIQNYIAGISRIRYRQFVLASLLGNGPVVFVLAFLGDGLTEPGSPAFWLALGAFVLAMVVPPAVAYAVKRRGGGGALGRTLRSS